MSENQITGRQQVPQCRLADIRRSLFFTEAGVTSQDPFFSDLSGRDSTNNGKNTPGN